MKIHTKYRVSYQILCAGGGTLSSSLESNSIDGLLDKMRELVNESENDREQAVLFEPIEEVTVTKLESKGSFVQFVPKFKFNVYYGEDVVDSKFYKPLKRH